MTSTPSAAYDPFAEFYDATTPDRSAEIAFYHGLVGPATRSLLDLGCGTGIVTVAVAGRMREFGPVSRVVGIDESPSMLAIARERDPDIEWRQGDLRRPGLEGTFDLVLCCFNTLQLAAPKDADMLAALGAARQLSAPCGRLAFDIYQPNLDYLNSGLAPQVVRRFTAGDRHLAIRQTGAYDAPTRVLTIDWDVIDDDQTAAPPLSSIRSTLRQYFSDEMETLLELSGWHVSERFGDYDRRGFDSTSRKQLMVCDHA